MYSDQTGTLGNWEARFPSALSIQRQKVECKKKKLTSKNTTTLTHLPCSRSVFSKALSRARTTSPTPFYWPICLLYPTLIGHCAFIHLSNHLAFTLILWSWNDTKSYTAGTSLMVQQLRLCIPMHTAWVQTLAGKLNSHISMWVHMLQLRSSPTK